MYSFCDRKKRHEADIDIYVNVVSGLSIADDFLLFFLKNQNQSQSQKRFAALRSDCDSLL
jgi:hypothetical protein